MTLCPVIILAALTATSVVMLVYWIAVGLELGRTRRELPTARDGVAASARWLAAEREGRAASGGASEPSRDVPGVCVIIPAHNEAHCIGIVAASLKAQDYPAMRVVFALDRCTDGTEDVLAREIGEDRRFEVLRIDSCPEGWAGKTNAAWQGVQRGRHAQDAELLLFADADTEFDHRCVSACVALLRERGVSLLSLMTSLSTDRWFEKVVQPVACYEMLRQFPPRRVNREHQARPLANGQFMLFTREAYEAVGGHAAVREELLEDIALAKAIKRSGRRLAFLPAAGMMRVRMYENFRGFVAGWKRIYGELAHRRPRRLRKYAVKMVLADVALPCGALLAMVLGVLWSPAGVWPAGDGLLHWVMTLAAFVCGLGAVVTWLGVVAAGARWGSNPFYVGLFHPLGAVVVAWILWASASDLERGREVVWAGKRYRREPRYEGDESLRRMLFGSPGAR